MVEATAALVPPGVALRRGLAENAGNRRSMDENIAIGAELIAREFIKAHENN